MSFTKEPGSEPLPGYRLIEPLGSGGFGEVWKCEAPGGLFKAIKFIYGNLYSVDVDSVRAEQEYEALHRVKGVRHPFVLSLEQIHDVSGEIVLVMELADKSLHDAYVECQAAGMVGIPRDALLRYIRDAAEALDHMNEKHNLQHLDIKPRNLFLISDRVKVADFGLVKHLERQNATGMLGGVTPLYAPPETFNGKITEFSDQYSLAIVYQELLTGQRPFTGKNVRMLAQQHLSGEPELRPLPEAERPVVARALSKDPTKRFPTCLAFVRALYQAQGRIRPEPVAETPASGRPKTLAETLEDIQLEQQEAALEGSPLPAVEDEAARLGITVAQPQTGTLRPTLILGVGTFGRRALLELRCRLLDRFGDMGKLPMFRFLYVDTDPEAVKTAQLGSAEVALTSSEVYHLPLQPVGQYRKRMLDHLLEWLPREKLYSIPRSLATQGSRALGRLALVDNHLRFQARLRRDVQKITHPDTLYQTVSQTGLALRDAIPRVCVVAAAGGGSSGCLLDLSYTLRNVLQQLRHTEAEVLLFLFVGTPSDPATPKLEQANLYATLTEINHFMDPAVPFSAQYGADGPRVVDQGQPFACAYLLQMAHRSPEGLRDVVGHLGSYLFHEMTTPLGLRLDRGRRQKAAAGERSCFRSFGTAAIWFPRGLLLRLAAKQACQRLLQLWQAAGAPTAKTEVEAACASALADPELRPESIAGHIEDSATILLEGRPGEALTSLLASLEEQSLTSVALDDPGNWARQSLGRVREWTGVTSPSNGASGVASSFNEWQRSRLSRALKQSAEKLAEEWEKKLGEAAFALMEHPGQRVAAAEAALTQFMNFCQETAQSYTGRLVQHATQTQQAWKQLESALEACLAGPGTFSLFGNRTRRHLRVFMDRLAAFARQRLVEEVTGAGQQFFGFLRVRLADRLRDLSLIRQRLHHLQDHLLQQEGGNSDDVTRTAVLSESGLSRSPLPSAEAFWESIRQSAATARIVLPDGEFDLEQAAARFLGSLTPEHWVELDQSLQEGVLTHLGGLHDACMRSGDLTKILAVPLLDRAVSTLDSHLPITDVAEIELQSGGKDQEELAERVRAYYEGATPLAVNDAPTTQSAYLLVPASDAGKAFGEAAHKVVPELQEVRVPGQAHLMFCREQGFLSTEDLRRLLRPCRSAYDKSSVVPVSSPHARFDIVDWLPLDP